MKIFKMSFEDFRAMMGYMTGCDEPIPSVLSKREEAKKIHDVLLELDGSVVLHVGDFSFDLSSEKGRFMLWGFIGGVISQDLDVDTVRGFYVLENFFAFLHDNTAFQ